MAERRVTAYIHSPAQVAARLPSLSGPILVPRLEGWTTQPLASMLMRVRAAFVRATTEREMYLQSMRTMFGARLDRFREAHSRNETLLDVCKSWVVESRQDAPALEAMCLHPEAEIDGSVASVVIDSCAKFGEMQRSRVFSALAEHVLHWEAALKYPDAASRVFAASQTLPWAAPMHETMASAVATLDRDLFYETSEQERRRLEGILGVTLEDFLAHYARHPRSAVLAEVAAVCERPEVLRTIATRAEELQQVDPRLALRVIEALAKNNCATLDLLQPFAKAEMWVEDGPERKALDALLRRGVGFGSGPLAATPAM